MAVFSKRWRVEKLGDGFYPGPHQRAGLLQQPRGSLAGDQLRGYGDEHATGSVCGRGAGHQQRNRDSVHDHLPVRLFDNLECPE